MVRQAKKVNAVSMVYRNDLATVALTQYTDTIREEVLSASSAWHPEDPQRPTASVREKDANTALAYCGCVHTPPRRHLR